jgi:hypothetical protein
MKFGSGELGTQDNVTRQAQSFFFKKLRQIVPEVVEDLRGEPYELYLNFQYEYENALVFNDLFVQPCFEPLLCRLKEWAGRWHLEADWCLLQAWYAFIWWESALDDPENYDANLHEADDWTAYSASYERSANPDEQVFKFEYRTPDLSFRTIKDIKEEVREAFERELNEHLERLAALAKQRGFIDIPVKRGDDHFVWLIQFQVQGWSMQKIANEYGAGRKTVEEGINAVAALIQLSRRDPLPSGRPAQARVKPQS